MTHEAGRFNTRKHLFWRENAGNPCNRHAVATVGAVTYAYGIDGSNIVGYYGDGSGSHGFIATVVPLSAAS